MKGYHYWPICLRTWGRDGAALEGVESAQRDLTSEREREGERDLSDTNPVQSLGTVSAGPIDDSKNEPNPV